MIFLLPWSVGFCLLTNANHLSQLREPERTFPPPPPLPPTAPWRGCVSYMAFWAHWAPGGRGRLLGRPSPLPAPGVALFGTRPGRGLAV